MAVGGLLALLDDITVLLDDIAVLSKAAATKTAGIVGDDLAVNAQAMVGIDPKRELPIVWRVALGSFKNKFVLVPAALILNLIAEWAITPFLMLGGAFLCYEGAEKVFHALRPTRQDKKHEADVKAASHVSADALLALEKQKIKEAVNTDFILSGEIVAVTLYLVKEETLLTQVAVLSGIALAMTVIVYGLVAAIVKLDDLGLYLATKKSAAIRKTGAGILRACPYLMKTLSVIGTVAMFSVGGGIMLHGIPAAAEAMHHWGKLANIGAATGVGVVVGAICVPVMHMLEKPIGKLKAKFARKKPAKA
ncbi:MAG TPA: DUF808 domain-containing protein [Patescibacteria group bacterium]|nr:DUF808 domain-containing protein [Patescibacteria group bacterium]